MGNMVPDAPKSSLDVKVLSTFDRGRRGSRDMGQIGLAGTVGR